MLNPKVCWTSGRSPQLVRTKRKIQFLTNLNTGVEVFMADWGGGGDEVAGGQGQKIIQVVAKKFDLIIANQDPI